MRPLPLAAAALLALAPLAAPAQDAPAATTVDEFATAAAQNSLAEVAMSALALQKSDDERVEDYAWTMLDHHASAMGDLAGTLGPDAALLPAAPGAEQQAMLEEMRALEGAEFDEAYLQHQVEAHGQAIAVFEQGAELPDEQVAEYARTTLPILRAHLEIAQISQEAEPMPEE